VTRFCSVEFQGQFRPQPIARRKDGRGLGGWCEALIAIPHSGHAPVGAYRKSKQKTASGASSKRLFGEVSAGIAQLVEQLICNQQVIGSSPIAGSPFESSETGNGSASLNSCSRRTAIPRRVQVLLLKGCSSPLRREGNTISLRQLDDYKTKVWPISRRAMRSGSLVRAAVKRSIGSRNGS
jgi:hypothetical protein